ncbi:MAG: hypothetical protein ACRD0P_04070 [Stackebrandtia sp.]
MPPQQRARQWDGLVEWVAWLYDRYELAVAHRLPHCWPRHPGLIEELWALKQWRDDIYTNNPAGTGEPAGLGQAARYWHTELRNVITNAEQLYAGKCRSGHKQAETLADTTSNLKHQWQRADPLIGINPTLVTNGTSPSAVTTKSDAAINDALMRGAAKPLGRTVTEHVEYLGSWWSRDEGGQWVKITDPGLAAHFNQAAIRIRQIDTEVDTFARPSNGPAAPRL